MPILTKCPDHPEAVVNYPDEIFAHAAEAHSDVPAQAVFDGLERRFVSQAHALGRPELRIIHCRRCATRFSVSIAPGADGGDVSVLCEACRG